MKNRKVYISASSRGLGFETALLFASEGHEVALSGRSKEHLEQAKKKITDNNPYAVVRFYAGNLSNQKDQQNILDKMAADNFTPDVFVCSSGQPADTTLRDLDRQTWQDEIEMIQGQAIFAAQQFAPEMAKKSYGRFIFISSVWTKNPGSHYLAGSMARAGLYVLSKAIVEEFAESHVASFVINLGFIDTPLLRNMALGRDNDDLDPAEGNKSMPWTDRYREWANLVPAKKIGSEKDLSLLIKFLSSSEAEYCNGSVFSFSGGMDRNLI